ncbi:type I-E CRISPR-associated protein Cse2/CasB [Streptomyces sp. CC219B]|uniref:type I-E CRISPR-associated protein Cse2/CasB n=1 Tax=Streptomyces sp. CC219B TaxID=3044574 RepID=UPI0024A7C809|nr:type I-E CRISPR-associated protein Cse2/CasB [Streptomyces sp. CC219B]
MPTAAERRRHYQDFTTEILHLCTDPGVRRDLRDGRGRPVKECLRMHRYLTVRTAGHGQRHAHYTVASLIALADPLEVLRTRATPAPRQTAGEVAAQPPSTDLFPSPVTDSSGTPAAPPAAQAPPPGPPDAPGPVQRDLDPYTTAAWRKRPNLGVSLARAVRRAGFNEDRTDDLLHVIVRVGDDHLHQHLLPCLTDRLLHAGLAWDWPVLLDDLAARVYDPDQVATRWLDAFYLTLNPIKD